MLEGFFFSSQVPTNQISRILCTRHKMVWWPGSCWEGCPVWHRGWGHWSTHSAWHPPGTVAVHSDLLSCTCKEANKIFIVLYFMLHHYYSICFSMGTGMEKNKLKIKIFLINENYKKTSVLERENLVNGKLLFYSEFKVNEGDFESEVLNG